MLTVFGETSRVPEYMGNLLNVLATPFVHIVFDNPEIAIEVVLRFSPRRLHYGKSVMIMCSGQGAYTVRSWYSFGTLCAHCEQQDVPVIDLNLLITRKCNQPSFKSHRLLCYVLTTLIRGVKCTVL